MGTVPVSTAPWPWWAAGFAIGLYVVLLAWISGKALGISTGYGTLCSLTTRCRFFQQPPYTETWRLWFLLGVPLGAWLAMTCQGSWAWTWRMGMFEPLITASAVCKAGLLFVGGLCIGAGSRWAGGCTSGHSIVGTALGARSSLVATAGFMLGGVATTQLLYWLALK